MFAEPYILICIRWACGGTGDETGRYYGLQITIKFEQRIQILQVV